MKVGYNKKKLCQVRYSPKKEMKELIAAVVSDDGVDTIDAMLCNAESYEVFVPPYPHERLFHKKLSYHDFNLHISRIVEEGPKVVEFDMQFKRRSKFPAPFLDRNRKLFKEMKVILESHYHSLDMRKFKSDGITKIHYKPVLGHFESMTYTEWRGVCSLFSEPYSPGQVDPEDTDIRNDFIIIRFNKYIHKQTLD